VLRELGKTVKVPCVVVAVIVVCEVIHCVWPGKIMMYSVATGGSSLVVVSLKLGNVLMVVI
jgi:hypothetical protein